MSKSIDLNFSNRLKNKQFQPISTEFVDNEISKLYQNPNNNV